MKKLLTTTALTLGALTALAYGQMQPTTPGTYPTSAASGTIQYSVAVCDPNSPFRCAAPNASGQLPVTMSGSSSVTTQPYVGTFTSKNATITLGGTAQTLMAANTSRKKIYIQNPCTAAGQGIAGVESIYISFTGTAAVNAGTSIEILACGSYETDAGPLSSQAISVNAATTGHKIVAGEM